jgi:predicted MFS family arabinose efflux permease
MNHKNLNGEGAPLRWYQGLDRYCWVVLLIAALGWLFDTMDQNLFNLVRSPSLTDLLGKTGLSGDALKAAVKDAGGTLTAVFLLGWAVGGFVFGILGDKIGRTGTMILTILIYAIFTGLSGFAWNFESYAAMRFMTALGVGGEWAAGASLVAEVFPSRSRPMALGLLQALSAFGNMSAALITLALGNLQTQWRTAYFIGAIPAILVLWIRRSVKEPEAWTEARRHAHSAAELGNIRDLFGTPELRRNVLAATMMAAAGVGALWGIGFFSTDMLQGELQKTITDPQERGQKVSIMFLVQNLGAFFGIYSFAAVSEWLNRRKAFFLWFGLAWVSILAYFWGVSGSGPEAFTRALLLAPVMGFCTLGPFSGYSVYFPELFPTRLRATGAGFCYNAARILSAGAPFALGQLSNVLGGFAPAATVVSSIYLIGFLGAAIGPETKGKPLPE